MIQPFLRTELDIITSSVERYKSQKSYAENPTLDEDEWNHLQDIMDEADELPERLDYQTYVDTKFAKKSWTEKTRGLFRRPKIRSSLAR